MILLFDGDETTDETTDEFVAEVRKPSGFTAPDGLCRAANMGGISVRPAKPLRNRLWLLCQHRINVGVHAVEVWLTFRQRKCSF